MITKADLRAMRSAAAARWNSGGGGILTGVFFCNSGTVPLLPRTGKDIAPTPLTKLHIIEYHLYMECFTFDIFIKY